MSATSPESRSPALQAGIVMLTLAAATIHFYVALRDPSVRLLFLANSLGYVTWLALLYLPIPQLEHHRSPARWALFGWAAVTFAGYFAWSLTTGQSDPLGLVDKAIEAVLMILLIFDSRQST